MKYFFIILPLLLIPAIAWASPDLSIDSQDIRFSKDVLVAGDEVRIYAKIYNVGDEDVSGYVSFYQGTMALDDSLVISLPANGNAEEVYVDFIVPEGKFNILALIRGTDPADINSNNDSALTSTFAPILDDDRDGNENDNDNCPTISNSDQLDTDNDGQGNACDADDDNDSLSDEVENELNTDTTNNDSDGDGVSDADDAYPTDGKQSEVGDDLETTEKLSVENSEAFQSIVKEVARAIEETTNKTDESEPATVTETKESTTSTEAVAEDENTISPHAVFSYKQDDWNAFSFRVLGDTDESVIYIWDFGDGTTSSKSEVQHVYNSSGEFIVALTVSDENGVVATETTEILVPFFHLKNRLVSASVILFALLLLIAIGLSVRLRKKGR